MNVERLPIDGALLIFLRVFSDDRGYFKETYAQPRYQQAGVEDTFVQDNVSLSRRWTLRGLHAAHGMAKLVQVLRGAAFDVIADIRKGSPTFGQWCATTIRADDHQQVYIPAGCLHGFLALENETLLSYKQTATYDPGAEVGVIWSDATLGIRWPLGSAAPLVSPKDAANPSLTELGLL
jgi:dTDP-4-dehydrorhamnose 3,5-epimerase